MGIIVCGMNGSGKSTLGKVLAQKLNYLFIDNEDLFFSESANGYHSPRTKEEAINILMSKVSKNNKFVFSAVTGNYGNDIIPMYNYAVLIEVPKDIRLCRIKERSYRKFGNRVNSGGDLYAGEKSFFDFAANRPDNYTEDWVKSLSCPVIRIDGTKPIDENIKYIIETMNQRK
jgi:adenylate kinase family enzyme